MTEADLKDAVANEPTPVGLTVETVVSVSVTPPPPPPPAMLMSTVSVPALYEKVLPDPTKFKILIGPLTTLVPAE